MSITAIAMLTDAYRASNVIDENDTPSAEQGVVGLRVLNQMMGDWDEDGIKLGWQVVTSQAATLPLRFQDERAVKFNLAIELCGEFGIEPLPRVERIAARTYARLAKTYRKEIECALDLLPRESGRSGTGNINDGGF